MVVDDGNQDRVRGIVHALRLARLLDERGARRQIEPAVRDALIVPETKPLDDLLTELQRQRSSMGVVVDEYGRTVGIVTVEDILEEVVGEIEDETDPLAGVAAPARQRRLVRPRPRLARATSPTAASSCPSTPTPTTRSAATSSASWAGCPSGAT